MDVAAVYEYDEEEFAPTFEPGEQVLQSKGVHKDYYENLVTYYSNPKVKDRLCKFYFPIVHGYEGALPLRYLNYLVTRYCMNSSFIIEDIYGRRMELYEAYQEELRTYRKKSMDVYARGGYYVRIYPFKNKALFMDTNLLQMCFFRFAWKNKVVQFALAHVHIIKNALLMDKEEKKVNPKRKRKSTPCIRNTEIIAHKSGNGALLCLSIL